MSTSRSTAIGTTGAKLAGLAVVLVAWQVASLGFPFYVMPSVPEVASATVQVVTAPESGSYLGYVWDTFRRLLIGFSLSLAVGGFVGTQMGLHDEVENFLRTWIVFGLSLPALAIAFVLIMIFGINEVVPVLTITAVGVPFVALNMWEGAQDLDEEVFEMAAFFGASRWQRIRDVVVPQLLQFVFPSMYWGLIVCWKVLFIAEVFGAGSGVGYMVNFWFRQQRVDMLLGWVIIPVIVVILAQETLQWTEERLMDWR